MGRRWVLGVLLMALMTATAAGAQTAGGYLTGGNIGVGVTSPGGSGSTTGGGGSSTGGGGGGSVAVCTAGATTGPVSYSVVSAATAARLDTAGPRPEELFSGNGILVGKTQPAPTLNNPNPEPERGTWYAKSCGGVQAGYVWAPEGTTPGPPPPPPPPTAAEMWDQVPLPTPTFGVSPDGTGRTGMETRLWDTSTTAAPRTATATIRGWTATATATSSSWQWRMAEPGEPGPASQRNPNPVLSATQPGTAASPAATYTYETAGGYTLTLTVTWTGSYTYTRPGFTATTVPLGTSTREASRSYTVGTIKPVVVSGV